METARRDLETLPTAEKAILPGERFPEASLSIPTFNPSPEPGKNNSEQARATAPSQGWLLDALQKTDELNAQRGDRDPTKLRPSDSTAPRRVDAPPANPLGNYLNSWLSPQDKRLLPVGKPSDRTPEKSGPRQDDPFRPKSEFDALPAIGESRHAGLGLNAPRPNPYLQNTDSDQTLFAGPLTPLPSIDRKSAPGTTLLPLNDSTYSRSRDTFPTLENKKTEESLPVPTAPLIDERRYFPQLRRF